MGKGHRRAERKPSEAFWTLKEYKATILLGLSLCSRAKNSLNVRKESQRHDWEAEKLETPSS